MLSIAKFENQPQLADFTSSYTHEIGLLIYANSPCPIFSLSILSAGFIRMFFF